MRKTIFVILVLLFTSLCLNAEPINVVKDGLKYHAWFRNGATSQRKGYVHTRGHGLVISRTVLAKGDFTISCRLELEKVGGTAASFFFNGNNFGFDAGGNKMGQCFLEGPDITRQQQELPVGKIKANTPFTFKMKRHGENLSFFIDDQKVTTIKSTLDDEVLFAIRPLRSKIKIFDFSATGNRGAEVNEDLFAVKSSLRQKFPIINKPVDITKTLEIPVLKKTKSQKLTLDFTVNNKKVSQIFAADVITKNNKQYVAIPAVQLKKLYKSCESGFNVKTIYVQAKDAGGERFTEYAFAAFAPKKEYSLPESKVQKINGRVRVTVDGKLIEDTIAYQHEEHIKFKGDQVAGFDGSGVKLYRYVLSDYMYWKGPDKPNLDAIYKSIEASMLRMITHSPESRMILTWYIYMPSRFCTKYPQEALQLNTKGKSLRHTPGKTLQPSYASPKWREIRKEILTHIIKRISQSPWAERFIGIQLAYANAGEWNNWGYHKKAFPDFSQPMQIEFSNWLKNKYHTVENLRKAWDSPQAVFDNAVPSKTERMGKPHKFFREYPKDNKVVDYYSFWQKMTVDTIDYLAQVIKQASNNKLLVGAYYGYYLGHLPATPYHFQDSGHYGMEYYLRSPNLDFLCSPYPYSSRRLHCPLNYIFSSFTLHDKWMFIENDQRTQRGSKHQAPYGQTETLEESCEIAKRDFGLNLAKGSSYCFMDFAFGWYKDKEFLNTIKRLNEIKPVVLDQPFKKAQVAVLVGERGISYIAQQAGKPLVPTFEVLRRDLDQAGAPYDLYYSEDIDNIDFNGYKVVIFMNCLKFTAAQVELINKKIKTDQRNVIMLYGTGAIGDDGFDFKRMKHVTGIDMEVLPESIRSITSNKIKGRQSMRVYAAFSPVFSVTDKSVTTLGKINKKYVGICEKKFSDHRVFYVGYTGLYWEWLRYFYKRSGVHISLDTPDTLYNNGSFYSVYTRSSGTRILKFPGKCEVVYDLYNGKELGRNVAYIKFQHPQEPTTTLIYAGKELSDKYKKIILK